MRGIEASYLWRGEATEPALERGAVVVEGETLRGVGGADELRARFPEAAWERHEGVLVPGLVNARASLELSALRGELAGGRGYGAHLAELAEARERLAPERDAEAIEAAVSELVRFGTAAVGEVTRTLAALESLASAPLVARVFSEIAGLRRETATIVRAMAEEQAEALSLPENVELSLAPQGTVGLHPGALAALFDGVELPVPLPLAVSPAERAFLADGGGPIGAWLRARGADPADWAPPGCGPVEHASALGVLGPSLLATHLTDARRGELDALAGAGARAVLCPRASLRVELKHPPLGEILAAAIAPGLGTDSLAVAPSLDVLEEAAALAARFPSVTPGALLAMATSGGARALGLPGKGLLAEGTSPGVLLFEGRGVDPLRHVLAQAGRPRRVLVRPGRVLEASR